MRRGGWLETGLRGAPLAAPLREPAGIKVEGEDYLHLSIDRDEFGSSDLIIPSAANAHLPHFAYGRAEVN
jgi:hypothetical protein